jgi:hypothetical protein
LTKIGHTFSHFRFVLLKFAGIFIHWRFDGRPRGFNGIFVGPILSSWINSAPWYWRAEEGTKILMHAACIFPCKCNVKFKFTRVNAVRFSSIFQIRSFRNAIKAGLKSSLKYTLKINNIYK